MNIKELRDIACLSREVPQIEDELETLKAKLIYAKGPKIDGMPHSHNVTDGTDMIVKYIDLKEHYKTMLADLLGRYKDLEKLVLKLPPDERRAIRYRYIMGMTIREVAQAMNYTERQIHRLLRSAESKICH